MLLRQTSAKLDERLNGSKSDGKKKVIETSKSNQEKNNVAYSYLERLYGEKELVILKG